MHDRLVSWCIDALHQCFLVLYVFVWLHHGCCHTCVSMGDLGVQVSFHSFLFVRPSVGLCPS